MKTSKKLQRINKHLQMYGLSTGKHLLYGIACIDTGHTYIGVTTSKRYKKRIAEHRTKLKRSVHPNKLMQYIYNNNTLVSYIIAQTDSKQLANALEQFCITYFREHKGNSLNLQDNKEGRTSIGAARRTTNKKLLTLISKSLKR